LPKLLLATTNFGKIKEYRSLLSGIGYQIVTLAEQGIAEVATESGDSYEQNAQLKATTYAKLSQLITLADDSGLHSARFAGKDATDADKIKILLAKLISTSWEERTAHFKCVIAIATLEGRLELCYGECHGIIAFEAKGGNGFGYDPVFYLPEMGKTIAELPLETKNQISHRGQAAQKAWQGLQSVD